MGNLRDAVQDLSHNFAHFKGAWENRFKDLTDAYDEAHEEFVKYMPKGAWSPHIEELEVAGNMAVAGMALAGTPAVIAVPVMYGLKKLAGLVGEPIEPVSADVTALKTRLKDIDKALRATIEHLSGQIMVLRGKAKGDESADKEQEIDDATNMLLLSPIWYPPDPKATAHLARPIEMRMWYLYFQQLAKANQAQIILGGGMNLDPMLRHLRDIGTEMNKFEVGWATPGSAPVYDYIDTIKLLARYGKDHMPLVIPHKFPSIVEEYIRRSTLKGLRNVYVLPGYEPWLPASDLTWASLGI